MSGFEPTKDRFLQISNRLSARQVDDSSQDAQDIRWMVIEIMSLRGKLERAQREAPTPPVKDSLTTAPDAGKLGEAWNLLADAMHVLNAADTQIDRKGYLLLQACLEKAYAIVQAAFRPAPITQGADTECGLCKGSGRLPLADSSSPTYMANPEPEGAQHQAPEGLNPLDHEQSK